MLENNYIIISGISELIIETLFVLLIVFIAINFIKKL